MYKKASICAYFSLNVKKIKFLWCLCLISYSKPGLTVILVCNPNFHFTCSVKLDFCFTSLFRKDKSDV